MESFLGPACFAPPPYVPMRGPASFVGQASFNGALCVCNWLRRDAEALLPAGLMLAANRASPELHPVVFLFGEQADGATIFGGMRFPVPVRYGEFGIAVPFVVSADSRQLYTFVPRMYSSYFPAVWHGNAHFGFAKECATMDRRGPFFLMTGADGGLLFHAAVEGAGEWAPGNRADALPNFTALHEMFAFPILGRKPAGRWAMSTFGWDFAEATIRPASCWLSIDSPLVAGVEPRICHAVAGGAFEVRGMLWQLGWPRTD